MVDFRTKNKLGFRKLVKREANGHSDEDITLSVDVEDKPRRGFLRSWLESILLLTLGVFGGLFAYNYFTGPDAESLEQVYLENFRRDLNEDIKDLRNSIALNSSRILDVKDLLSDLYRNPVDLEVETFSNRYMSAVYVSKFTPTTPTFNDFSTYSKQNVLTNPRLRNEIFRYYDEVHKATEKINTYETEHKKNFVPKFNSNIIRGRALTIFRKYYENIDVNTDPDLRLWKVSKDSDEFIEAENLLLQRLEFLDRSIQIEGELITKARKLNQEIENELGNN